MGSENNFAQRAHSFIYHQYRSHISYPQLKLVFNKFGIMPLVECTMLKELLAVLFSLTCVQCKCPEVLGDEGYSLDVLKGL